MKASNVTGCSGSPENGKGKGKGCGTPGSCQGTVKSFSEKDGWGFIQYNGQDVFVHIRDCQGGRPQAGDTVSFDLDPDQFKGDGRMKASNVTGGTGWSDG